MRLVKQVRNLDDVSGFIDTLASWCNLALPEIERGFRPKDLEIQNMVTPDFLSRTGTLVGYVNPAIITARLAHWRAEAISRVRAYALGTSSNAAIRSSSRSSRSVVSPLAAQRADAYRRSKNLTLTEFAGQIGTTDRTLRQFFKTGKLRRSIFNDLATSMGITAAALLSE